MLPDDFYSTTNMPTFVRAGGQWVEVAGIEMDVAIVVDRKRHTARACPMHEAREGDQIVVGYEGIRVEPLERPRQREAFGFMQSAVSSERAKALAIADVAEAMREARARGGRTLFVLGPAVVHTAARQHVAALIQRGYIQVIFGGNAIIAHDIEAAMFGTSLGVRPGDWSPRRAWPPQPPARDQRGARGGLAGGSAGARTARRRHRRGGARARNGARAGRLDPR